MRKTIACPIVNGVYDTDTQIEMENLYSFAWSIDWQEFAILDALSLEYLCKIEIH